MCGIGRYVFKDLPILGGVCLCMFGSSMVLAWEQVCDVLRHGTARNCLCGELFGDVMGGWCFDLIYAFNDEKMVDLFS